MKIVEINVEGLPSPEVFSSAFIWLARGRPIEGQLFMCGTVVCENCFWISCSKHCGHGACANYFVEQQTVSEPHMKNICFGFACGHDSYVAKLEPDHHLFDYGSYGQTHVQTPPVVTCSKTNFWVSDGMVGALANVCSAVFGLAPCKL